MNRVIFLIDGFNLYHSIVELKRHTGYSTKWLDIDSLCRSYLHLFGKGSSLGKIYYFSAIPYYLIDAHPDKVRRHKDYVACLEERGVCVELGRFKQKDVYCDKCKSMVLKHEEKETDVAIAIKLLEIFFTDACDIAVIVSGDTDLSPAIRRCKALFKDKKVVFAFPYARKNKELTALTPDSFSINRTQYIKHQFPNPVMFKDGRSIKKPDSW
jgi:uncharacterized LabA/DUF88 family protein